MVRPLWKTAWKFLTKLKLELLYDPAVPILGIYPQKTNCKRSKYPNVHSSTVYNSQDMEATCMSVDRLVDMKMWYTLSERQSREAREN